MIKTRSEVSLQNWQEREKLAMELLQISTDLRLDRSIELILFRKVIYDTRPSGIVHNHFFAKHYSEKEITVQLSVELAKAIQRIRNLAPVKIDLGHLGMEWLDEKDKFFSIEEFVNFKLNSFIGVESLNRKPKDVVLYGFGRIGRIAAREIIAYTGKGDQLRLRAIVIRPKLKDRYAEVMKRAHLFRSDSVHGDFQGSIEVSHDGKEMIVNGNRIQMIFANHPSEIDYTEYGIKDALLIDNTGVWRDKDGLSGHLRPGVTQVMLSAPGKNMPNVVFGVNHDEFDLEKENVFSAASCTTNAIVPVIKVINDAYGIEKGHVESIHSYTNDQNLLDNFHKKPRRGKGAATNMVLTTTGAAKAVAKVLPELDGLLTGNAVRVPTPNVSLAILNLTVKKKTSLEKVNTLLKNASLNGELVEQIHYSDSNEYVSSDAIGMITTSVVDAPSTKVSKDGKSITLYLWYDNEWGYTVQLVRLAAHAAKVRRYTYF